MQSVILTPDPLKDIICVWYNAGTQREHLVLLLLYPSEREKMGILLSILLEYLKESQNCLSRNL
jgi:hypothetical protein